MRINCGYGLQAVEWVYRFLCDQEIGPCRWIELGSVKVLLGSKKRID